MTGWGDYPPDTKPKRFVVHCPPTLRGSTSRLPEGRFEYQILLLRPANKNVIRKELSVIHQCFHRGVGERIVIEVQPHSPQQHEERRESQRRPNKNLYQTKKRPPNQNGGRLNFLCLIYLCLQNWPEFMPVYLIWPRLFSYGPFSRATEWHFSAGAALGLGAALTLGCA